MEKTSVKSRTIKFYSKKNETVVYVHSQEAKKFAKKLEENQDVKTYETLKPIDTSLIKRISHVGIRKEYLDTMWASDFMVQFTDGRQGIREIVEKRDLERKFSLETLELSRRCWVLAGISDWKMVTFINLAQEG